MAIIEYTRWKGIKYRMEGFGVLTNLAAIKSASYLRSSDQEIDCADIGISAPSTKLI